VTRSKLAKQDGVELLQPHDLRGRCGSQTRGPPTSAAPIGLFVLIYFSSHPQTAEVLKKSLPHIALLLTVNPWPFR